MSTWEDKAAFARFLDQAVNNGNVEVVHEIFHENFVGYFPDTAEPARGPEGCSLWVKKLRNAFGDINSLVEGGWLVAETGTHEVGKGTVVKRMAAFIVLRGTHTGTFGRISPSNKWVTWGEVHLLTFENGRISQDVVIRDSLSLIQQLGETSLENMGLPTIIPPILI